MINYSLTRLGNPLKQEEKKYYGRVQFNESLTLEEFAEHIAGHNVKYDGADIYAVIKISVKCLQELVKQGYKVSLGDLGAFYPTISSTGADTMKDFTNDNIRALSIGWDRPKKLDDIKEGVKFRKVVSRAMQSTMLDTVEEGQGDNVMEYMNALQKDDSAVTPDNSETTDGNVPDVDDTTNGDTTAGGDDNGGNSGSTGGSDDDDPNA